MNDRIVRYIQYHPVRTQRGLEILTGLVPWGIILFPLVGSFFVPTAVAYFVIAFNIYWLYRSLQMAVYATSGYLNIKATQQIDWFQRLRSDPKSKTKYRSIYHLVIIPNVREPLVILERNINSLLSQNFPRKNFFVVLAMEERTGEEAREKSKKLLAKYRGRFGKIIATFHRLVLGETVGKHSNEAYAAKTAQEILVTKNHLDSAKVLVTTCDADSVFPQEYFSLLTYKFLTAQNPQQKFFQAPLFAYNNLHRVPLLVRVPSIIGGIYFLSMLQKHSKRFLNYSTYSLSLALLEKVGYWDTDVIPEDWHLYFKSYFTLRGQLEIVPLYLPVTIDAAESSSRLKTYQNRYEQNKREAWGVIDIPYVVKNFFLHPEIPFWEKIIKISIALEYHFVWSSYWFLITLGATIPTIVNPIFARTALGFNLSRMSSTILTLGLTGILAIVAVDTLLNPHHKNKLKVFLHPLTYLQWLVLPLTGLVFGSLPGLESQTRLMLGKYLEYRVTEKV